MFAKFEYVSFVTPDVSTSQQSSRVVTETMTKKKTDKEELRTVRDGERVNGLK